MQVCCALPPTHLQAEDLLLCWAVIRHKELQGLCKSGCKRVVDARNSPFEQYSLQRRVQFAARELLADL